MHICNPATWREPVLNVIQNTCHVRIRPADDYRAARLQSGDMIIYFQVICCRSLTSLSGV